MAARARATGDARAPRTGARRTVLYYIRHLPRYIRLLAGLVADRRVAMVDKLLVMGAIAYIIMPADLVPDFVPFFGDVDDLYLLILALKRLTANAGRAVLLSHWSGPASELSELNIEAALAAAAFFLPKRLRRRLRVMART